MEKIKIFLLHFKIGAVTFSLQLERDPEEEKPHKKTAHKENHPSATDNTK